MSGKSYFFVQSITINGKQLDKGKIESTTYIEHVNMNGSLLILEIADESGSMRDENRVKSGGEVVALLGDPDGSGTLFQEIFTILKAPVSNGRMRICAIQKDMDKLKKPSPKAIFLADKPTLQSVKTLASGIPIEAGRVTGLCTYHLDAGEAPSGLLREIAKDHACLCYWSRGKLHLVPYSEAFQQPPVIMLESHNPKAEHTIAFYKWLDHDFASERQNVKRYSCYSMTEGWQYSAGNDDAPIEFVPNATLSQLNNRLKHIVPLLEVETAGDGALQAGVMVGIRINKMSNENVLDESAPPEILITRVIHHETPNNYMCTLELGVLRG